jgi:hypothetical protein
MLCFFHIQSQFPSEPRKDQVVGDVSIKLAPGSRHRLAEVLAAWTRSGFLRPHPIVLSSISSPVPANDRDQRILYPSCSECHSFNVVVVVVLFMTWMSNVSVRPLLKVSCSVLSFLSCCVFSSLMVVFRVCLSDLYDLSMKAIVI